MKKLIITILFFAFTCNLFAQRVVATDNTTEKEFEMYLPDTIYVAYGEDVYNENHFLDILEGGFRGDVKFYLTKPNIIDVAFSNLDNNLEEVFSYEKRIDINEVIEIKDERSIVFVEGLINSGKVRAMLISTTGKICVGNKYDYYNKSISIESGLIGNISDNISGNVTTR